MLVRTVQRSSKQQQLQWRVVVASADRPAKWADIALFPSRVSPKRHARHVLEFVVPAHHVCMCSYGMYGAIGVNGCNDPRVSRICSVPRKLVGGYVAGFGQFSGRQDFPIRDVNFRIGPLTGQRRPQFAVAPPNQGFCACFLSYVIHEFVALVSLGWEIVFPFSVSPVGTAIVFLRDPRDFLPQVFDKHMSPVDGDQ